VIPDFRGIFVEFNLELPGLTRWMLAVSDWLSSWGLLTIAALLILFALSLLNSRRLLPSSAFAWLGDRFRPSFGRRTAVARFTRFTADLLDAGVNMPDALRIAGFTTSRSGLQRAAWRLASDLESGAHVAQRSYQRPLTATVLRAITADMPTASRIRLLREISSCHAERVRVGLSWTSGIIEPMAIVLVGLVVGLTVLALFVPLVKLVEGLSQ
jgi:type II secretory pathway component PulF